MSLPKYPAYKDSGVAWLGEVPEHWDIKRLKQMATINNGRDYKNVEVDDGGYPVIGSGGEFTRANEYLYSGESVLLGRKGTIDRPLYINGAFWTVDTMFYTQVHSDTNSKFLYYCTLTIQFDLYSTSTALPSMTQADLAGIHFAVPKMVEQTAIANFLDQETGKIDALVAEQEKLIALLKEKRQAVISHAVTKGLNPNAPMKDSGIEWLGEVPAHWEVKPLKFVVSMKSGEQITSDNIDAEGDYPVFGGNGHRGYTSNFTHEGHFPLIGRQGALCGNINYGQGKFWASEHAVVVSPQIKCSIVWLGEMLRTMNLGQYSITAAQPGLSVEAIGNLRIPFPPFKEQTNIADLLNAETAKLDTLTTESERVIALFKERRNALISAAVTGKIDVRNIPLNTQVPQTMEIEPA
jgi:type I restriction enzyme, S subunit